MPRKKISKTEKKADSKLHADIYNLKGKAVGKSVLPAGIFNAKINPSLLAQSVRVYLANQRLGTHSTKTRSEVAGSTRKIYRQKGTGRARHGDIKAPIFIGGGIAFGPKPREYRLSLSKQMKRKALFGALTDKFIKGKIRIIKGLEEIPSKTKEMAKVLINLQLLDKKPKKETKTLLVLSNNLENILLAGRNLSHLTISQARQLNAYSVLNHQNLLFTQSAISALSDSFLAGTKEAVSSSRQAKSVQAAEKEEIKRKTSYKKKSKTKEGAKKTGRKKTVSS